MVLPRFVLLKSNSSNKFLQYVIDGTDEFLQFSCDSVVNSYNQFELKPATSKSNKGLFHIRSCYKNKYLVRLSKDENQIVALADEPNEDRSTWQCTLFEPVVEQAGDSNNTTVLSIRHVQLSRYTRVHTLGKYSDCLVADMTTPDNKQSPYTILDVQSLVILPKKVAFLQGDDGRYLCNNQDSLQFSSNDIADLNVPNEVTFNLDGSVAIKSTSNGKWWVQNSDSTISASADSVASGTSFWLIKIDYNIIAIRLSDSSGQPMFLSRSVINDIDCLCASTQNISLTGFLTVEEPLLSRDIYSIQYNLSDARIYNQKVINMATGDAVNHTDKDDTVTMDLSYMWTKTNSWNASGSLKLCTKVTMATGIPSVAEGKVTVSAEISYTQQWGVKDSNSTLLGNEVDVIVPSNGKVRASQLATTASYDIPFSYVQKDTDLSGNSITQTLNDGIYRGSNCYNFEVSTTN